MLGEPHPTTFIDQGVQGFELRLTAGRTVDPLRAHHLAEHLLRPPLTTPHVSRGGTREGRGRLLPAEAETPLTGLP